MEAIAFRLYLALIFFMSQADNAGKLFSPPNVCGCIISEIIYYQASLHHCGV